LRKASLTREKIRQAPLLTGNSASGAFPRPQANYQPYFIMGLFLFFKMYYNKNMELSNKPININISTWTIAKVFLFFLLVYFLYLIKDILAVLFVSLILSSAIDPTVDAMHKRKIPRAVSVLFIYAVFFIVISFVVYSIIPPIIQETSELSVNFPRILDKIISSVSSLKNFASEHGVLDGIKNNIGTIGSNLQSAAGSIFSTVTGIFGGIFSFFLVLVLTFYMVVEEEAIKKLIFSIAPREHQTYVMQLINRMQKKMGFWLRGQIILCLVIFIFAYIVLLSLHVKYALVLAIFAGFTEFIPYLGPIIGSIPAVFIAFTQDPIKAIFVAVGYYIIQLMENNYLVPKVMQKAVGLNPIISISVLMIGLKVGGIVGGILSIPVATAISVFLKDFFESKEARK